MKRPRITRRGFLAGVAGIASGCRAVSRAPGVLTTRSPNETLLFAAIGCGNMGKDDIAAMEHAGARLVAMCDVDEDYVKHVYAAYPHVPKYRDFRVMLEEAKDADAVTVSTPDHTHAAASLLAMEHGKHVRVQKPMCHSVHEARELLHAARRTGAVTAMGNQGHSWDSTRQFCEMIWDGAIGEVREVHCWTDRPIWPQGFREALPAQPVPGTLDWDFWVGPAPLRPYNEGYVPWKWRGWWDFGCGALGDMGCHVMDPAYWALGLGYPSAVECVRQEGNTGQSGPTGAVVRYEFPERTLQGRKAPPVTLWWYEGGEMPPRPRDIPEDCRLGDGANGTLVVGSKGYMTCGGWGDAPRLVPGEADAAYARPAPSLPRVNAPRGTQSYVEFIEACKATGPIPMNSFEYSAPFTAVVLLGNIAVRSGGALTWDEQAHQFRDAPEANQLLGREPRAGW